MTGNRRTARTVSLALLLGAAGPAAAWTGGVERAVALPGPATDVAVVSVGGVPHVVAVDPDGVVWADAARGALVGAAAPGGRVVAAVDHDRDGLDDVVMCGDAGVWWLRGEASGLAAARQLTDTPCAAFAHFGADQLVTVSEVMRAWTIGDDGALSAPERLGAAVGAGPMLAVDGDRFALATTGAREVVERSAWGRSTFAASGLVGGLTLGPRSWAWSLPEQDVVEDVTRRRQPTAPDPGRLIGADLDGDGTRDLVITHPGAVGVLFGGAGTEHVVALGDSLDAVASGDLDGDGCQDLVGTVRGEPRLVVVEGACDGPVSPPVPRAGVPPLALPGPTGDPQPFRAPPPPPERPRLVVGLDWPTAHVKVGDMLSLQLVDAQGRADSWVGRGGPPGLLVSSAGIVTYAPLPEHVGEWSVGLRILDEVSLVRRIGITVVVDPADAPPPGQRSTPEPRSRAKEVRQGFFVVDSCLVGGGIAGGISQNLDPTWERLDEPIFLSLSPALAAGCDGGTPGVRWFAGADTAPLFAYVLDDGELGVHTLAITGALGIGTPKFNVGPYATLGILLSGIGLRVSWLPIEADNGARHGLELRGTLLGSGSLAGQAMLMYTLRMPPFR